MNATQTAPVQEDITNRLATAFSPVHLAIENESYKHSVPKGSETHFKVRNAVCNLPISLFHPIW